jgi:hypothetical protein
MSRAWPLLAILVAAVALLAAELGAGALSFGEPKLHDPCEPRPNVTGSVLQDLAYRGVDRLACTIGTTREQLVLDLAETAKRISDTREEAEDLLERALGGESLLSLFRRALDLLIPG